MTAAKLNLTIEQGTTWSQPLTWEDSAHDPVDLSGYTAAMQIRGGYTDDDDTVVVELADGDGITLGGVAGTIDLALSAEATAAIGRGRYRYDVELTAGDGTVTRLVAGSVSVVGAAPAAPAATTGVLWPPRQG